MSKIKKLIAFLFPILTRVLMLTLERQIQEALYGKPKPRQYGRPMTTAYVPPAYHNRTGKFSAESPAYPREWPSVSDQYNNLVFRADRQTDAQLVLEELQRMALSYEGVTVADYYELIDMGDITTHIDEQWGWKPKDLEDLSCTLELEGWTVKLPRPHRLR